MKFPKFPKKAAKRLTLDDLKGWKYKILEAKKPRKFGNKRTLCSRNHSHRSGLESKVCEMLLLREKAKEIYLEQVEATVHLTRAKIRYIADFKCFDLLLNRTFYVEAKGCETDRWQIIRKLYPFYADHPLEVWKENRRGLYMEKLILPEGLL